MSFVYQPDLFIYILISSFICFYGIYLIRMFQLSRATGKRINTLVYKFILRTVYFLLFMVSLLGPLIMSTRSVKDIQKNVFIAVDLSYSMTAADLAPSRFEICREKITELIDQLQNARIGIIVFSSEAFLHAPLTSDKKSLGTYVSILNPDILANKGSNLNTPVELALQKFSQTEGPVSNNIVLFSDGEAHAAIQQKLLKRAHKENIRIHTVGIGTREGSRLSVQNQQVISKLRSEILQEISSQSNGQYVEYSMLPGDIPSLAGTINKSNYHIDSSTRNDAETNKYFYFLIIAFYLMILDVLVTINILSL